MRCFKAAVVAAFFALGVPALAQAQATPLPPALVTLSPLAAVNPVGTSHTVTATVTDVLGQPVQGIIVRFTVTGASDPFNPGGFCTTDANGQCTFIYLGQAAGVDVITGCADTDDSGTIDTGEPCGQATKTWSPLPPPTCPGDEDSDGDRRDDANGNGNEDSDHDDGDDEDDDEDDDQDDDQDPCQDDSDDDSDDDEDDDE